MLKPECLIDEISLEEIFRDLRLATLAYKKIKRWEWLQGLHMYFLPKLFRIKSKEKRLSNHLIKELLPVAKSLSYFKVIHSEPKEVYFSGCINKDDFDDDIVLSVLSHETVHKFSPGACESVTTLLGCEIDARMTLRGHKIHQISLYKLLRNILRHVSYLKAKQMGQIEKWKDFMKSLYPRLMTEDYLAELIDDFERGGSLFSKVSDYTLSPYLSIKAAVKNDIDFVIDEFELFGSQKREKVEIPALIQVWEELTRTKGRA